MARIIGALIGAVVAAVMLASTPGSVFACEDSASRRIAPAGDQLEGRIAALLIAEVAPPSSAPVSLGVTMLVRSDSRLVTVIVLAGAQVFAADGAEISAAEIPPAATVLLTGRWAGEDLFEATRVELQ